MSDKTFAQEVEGVLVEIQEMLVAKRRDYGPGNLIDFGEFGILVRQGDKYHRLKNLLQDNTEPANESIEDTWRDMIGYAVLAILLRRLGAEAFVGLTTEPWYKRLESNER